MAEGRVLQQSYWSTPYCEQGCIVILMGDFNAQQGSDNSGLESIMCVQGIGKMTENRELWPKELIILHTFFLLNIGEIFFLFIYGLASICFVIHYTDTLMNPTNQCQYLLMI